MIGDSRCSRKPWGPSVIFCADEVWMKLSQQAQPTPMNAAWYWGNHPAWPWISFGIYGFTDLLYIVKTEMRWVAPYAVAGDAWAGLGNRNVWWMKRPDLAIHWLMDQASTTASEPSPQAKPKSQTWLPSVKQEPDMFDIFATSISSVDQLLVDRLPRMQ